MSGYLFFSIERRLQFSAASSMSNKFGFWASNFSRIDLPPTDLEESDSLRLPLRNPRSSSQSDFSGKSPPSKPPIPLPKTESHQIGVPGGDSMARTSVWTSSRWYAIRQPSLCCAQKKKKMLLHKRKGKTTKEQLVFRPSLQHDRRRRRLRKGCWFAGSAQQQRRRKQLQGGFCVSFSPIKLQ